MNVKKEPAKRRPLFYVHLTLTVKQLADRDEARTISVSRCLLGGAFGCNSMPCCSGYCHGHYLYLL